MDFPKGQGGGIDVGRFQFGSMALLIIPLPLLSLPTTYQVRLTTRYQAVFFSEMWMKPTCLWPVLWALWKMTWFQTSKRDIWLFNYTHHIFCTNAAIGRCNLHLVANVGSHRCGPAIFFFFMGSEWCFFFLTAPFFFPFRPVLDRFHQAPAIVEADW